VKLLSRQLVGMLSTLIPENLYEPDPLAFSKDESGVIVSD